VRLRDLSLALAGMLERFPGAGEGAPAGAAAFRRAANVGYPVAAPGLEKKPGLERDEAPLERLIRLASLSAEDLDLVVLAGMPEDHEGYASVFRALHPRGE